MFQFLILKTRESLRHLGVIGVVLSLSIFFSSLSSMALLSLASQFTDAMVSYPRERFGGDVSISWSDNQSDQDKINTIVKSLEEKGQIQKKTLTSTTFNYDINSKGRSELIPTRLIGLQDNSFPLLPKYTFDSQYIPYEKLKDGGVILSRDLMDKLKLRIGDEVTIHSGDYLDIKNYKIVGVVEDSTTKEGSLVFMRDTDTPKNAMYRSQELMLLGDQKEIEKAFEGQEINATTLDEFTAERVSSTKQFSAFFKAMSVFGLFIGSIGIAASMQVLIMRRKQEIGILKTVGYTRFQVILILLSELLVLSIFGAVLGIVVGFFLAKYLLNIFTLLSVGFLLTPSFQLGAAAIAFLASIASALLFALYSIIKHTRVKPQQILHDLPVPSTKKQKLADAGLFLLIGLIFSGFSVLLTESIPYGLGSVALVAVGVFLASLLFRLIFWLVLKVPVHTKNTLELSWITLKANYSKIILAVLSIFIGMVVISFIFSLIKTADAEVMKREYLVNSSVTVIAYKNGSDNSQVEKILKDNPEVNEYYVKTRQPIALKDEMAIGEVQQKVREQKIDMKGTYVQRPKVIEGRDLSNFNWDIGKVAEPLTTDHSVYFPFYFSTIYKINDEIPVIIDGQERQVKIAGFYQMTDEGRNMMLPFDYGLVTSNENYKAIVGSTEREQRVTYIKTKSENLSPLVSQLSEVPDSGVANIISLRERFNNTLYMAMRMVVSIASLALLAGLILMINSVTLEVVTRRRVFGILKAVGFNERQVRNMLLYEYGLIVMITSVFAIIIGYLIIQFINTPTGKKLMQLGEMDMIFDWPRTIALVVGTGILMMVLVFLVSRKYLSTKPVDVLRYE